MASTVGVNHRLFGQNKWEEERKERKLAIAAAKAEQLAEKAAEKEAKKELLLNDAKRTNVISVMGSSMSAAC